MDNSKEYQPRQPPTLEPQFREEWLDTDEEGNHRRGGFCDNFYYACCTYGFAPARCCVEIVACCVGISILS